MTTKTQTSKETYWSQDYVDMSRVLRQPMQFAVKLLWPVYEIANLESTSTTTVQILGRSLPLFCQVETDS